MKKIFLYISFLLLVVVFFAQAKNYYDFLGVKRNASEKAIKKAYHKLSKRLHPDRNPDEVEKYTKKFKLLGTVYGVLSDPAKRKKYDYYLDQQKKIVLNWHNIKMLEEIFNSIKRNKDLYCMITVEQEIEEGAKSQFIHGVWQRIPVMKKVRRRTVDHDLEKLYNKWVKMVRERIEKLKKQEEEVLRQAQDREEEEEEDPSSEEEESPKFKNLDEQGFPKYSPDENLDEQGFPKYDPDN